MGQLRAKVITLTSKPLTLQRMERLYQKYGLELNQSNLQHLQRLYEKYREKLPEELILLGIESNLQRRC